MLLPLTLICFSATTFGDISQNFNIRCVLCQGWLVKVDLHLILRLVLVNSINIWNFGEELNYLNFSVLAIDNLITSPANRLRGYMYLKYTQYSQGCLKSCHVYSIKFVHSSNGTNEPVKENLFSKVAVMCWCQMEHRDWLLYLGHQNTIIAIYLIKCHGLFVWSFWHINGYLPWKFTSGNVGHTKCSFLWEKANLTLQQCSI